MLFLFPISLNRLLHVANFSMKIDHFLKTIKCWGVLSIRDGIETSRSLNDIYEISKTGPRVAIGSK